MTGPDVQEYINDIDPLNEPKKVPAALRGPIRRKRGRVVWSGFDENFADLLIVLAIMLLCAMISAWVRATFLGF